MEQIITIGELAELLSTEEILKQNGVSLDDKVEVKISNRTLAVRTLNGASLESRMDEAMNSLMDRRSKLFEKLAEGAK